MNEDRVKIIEESADLLAESVRLYTKVIPAPKYIAVPIPRFRHEKGSVQIFAVLRCVRIASGARAATVLLRKGYVEEVGVLTRTILEFVHDLDFAIDGLVHKEHAAKVDARIQEFFSEDYRTAAEFMNETSKAPTTPRKKIYAALSRLFGGENPFRTRQIGKTLEEVYSGYVHGNYPHIMEIYEGYSGEFKTAGVPGKINEWAHYLSLSVHPALNVFSTVAAAFGMPMLEKALIAQRGRLETSPTYLDT